MLGFVKRYQDWFKENEALVEKLLHGNKVAFNKLFSCSVYGGEGDKLEKDFKACKAKVQKRLQEVKDMWQHEKTFDKQNTKSFSHQLCIVYDPPYSVFSSLHTMNGNTLL